MNRQNSVYHFLYHWNIWLQMSNFAGLTRIFADILTKSRNFVAWSRFLRIKKGGNILVTCPLTGDCQKTVSWSQKENYEKTKIFYLVLRKQSVDLKRKTMKKTKIFYLVLSWSFYLLYSSPGNNHLEFSSFYMKKKYNYILQGIREYYNRIFKWFLW